RLGVGIAEVTAYSHHPATFGARRLEVLQSLDLASAHQPGPPEHLHDAEELDDRAARDIVLGPSQGCIPQQLCIEAPIFREVCGLGALTESCVSLDRRQTEPNRIQAAETSRRERVDRDPTGRAYWQRPLLRRTTPTRANL